jgi:hypothetical protein
MNERVSESSSVGRAQPCQGWGREFESRLSLDNASCHFLFMLHALLSVPPDSKAFFLPQKAPAIVADARFSLNQTLLISCKIRFAFFDKSKRTFFKIVRSASSAK